MLTKYNLIYYCILLIIPLGEKFYFKENLLINIVLDTVHNLAQDRHIDSGTARKVKLYDFKKQQV